MKKLLIFGTVILGMLLIAGGASALSISGDGIYVGGVVDKTVYVGMTESPTPTLGELENPKSFMDSFTNVSLILNAYNTSFDLDLPAITTVLKNELEGDPLNGLTTGTIALSTGTEYLSLKWAADNGGWFLWNVEGLTTFNFTNLGHGLSHYTEWNGKGGTPVPEPASIFLLGVGLVGLASVQRKKLNKKK